MMPETGRTSSLLQPWTLLLVALLGGCLLLAAHLHAEHQSIELQEQNRLLARTHVVQLLLSESLGAMHTVMGEVRKEWAAAGYADRDGRLNERLRILAGAMPGVRMLLILDAEGFVRASTRTEIIGSRFAHRDYYRAVKEAPDKDMLYVSLPFVTTFGTYGLNISRLITRPDGSFGGVVSIGLDPRFFAPFLESVLYAPDMRTSIVHGQGVLFLLRPSVKGAGGASMSSPDSFFTRHMQAGNPQSVFSGRTALTGEDRMLALRTIRPAGFAQDHPLVVTASRDRAAIFAGWRDEAALKSMVFSALAALACLALFLYERRKREFLRRQALSDQALRDRERFMRTVTDNIPGLVGYWDKNHRCRFANRAYQEWFGLDASQLIGAHITKVLGPELYAKLLPHVTAALAGEPQHFERDMQKPDGSIGHALGHYIPDVVDGEVRGFFVLVLDISELKQTQLELERRVEARTAELRATVEDLSAAKAQAEVASRVKSEFLANLSHELRTPLNPILALTELVLATELDPGQREYLDEVRRASLKLLAMFNRLIELLELEDRRPESGPVNLATLLGLVKGAVAGQAEAKGLKFEATLDARLPALVWSDLGLLRMAAQELAENAVRFTETGSVALRLLETGTDEARELCVELADTGIGIPAERAEAVLTGFTQGDAPLTKRFGGLGIGLAKARKAVELLGGRLEFDSAPGRGTTARILISLRPFELSEEGGPSYVCEPGGSCSWKLG